MTLGIEIQYSSKLPQENLQPLHVMQLKTPEKSEM